MNYLELNGSIDRKLYLCESKTQKEKLLYQVEQKIRSVGELLSHSDHDRTGTHLIGIGLILEEIADEIFEIRNS